MSFERAGGVVIPFPQRGRAVLPPPAPDFSVASSDALGSARRRVAFAFVRAAWGQVADWVVLGLMLLAASAFGLGWVVVFFGE